MLGARELLREKLGDENAALPESIVKRITSEALGNADTKMSLIVRDILRKSDSLPGRLSELDDKGFIEEFQRIRQNYFKELIENGEFNEMTGASDFIKELSRNLEGRVAIFTGSQEQNADLEITALGLDDYLPKQYRVYASDLGPGQGKPNPAGFHLAREKLGLKVGDPWISGGDRWKDAVGALAAEGCVEFIVVAENLDRFKFQEPFGKLTNNDTSVLDGMNLDQNALDQLSIGVDKLPLRLVFVESLHKSCVEFVQIAPGEWPPRVNSLGLLRLLNLGR
jgi:beta-phosphoglucomutase-like phosphatase (HAD superfamily)